VSYTTRAPRAGERDGVEYHFVAPERFQEMVHNDEFAEYAMVHGNLYGTSSAQVSTSLSAGHDLIFDIDFQGGRSLRERFRRSVVSVFILPPSMEELERRLRNRGTDAPDVIERRLRMARMELAHYEEYDHVIINDDLDRAYDALRAVYVSNLHRMERQRDAAEALLRDDGEPSNH
jgi:guanylate kinase